MLIIIYVQRSSSLLKLTFEMLHCQIGMCMQMPCVPQQQANNPRAVDLASHI
jgi:hypothetical protein